MSDQGASATTCATCGYDLAGLPDGAFCPECGSPMEALPVDAIVHQPIQMIRRVTSGLALLSMTPLLIAVSAVVMFVGAGTLSLLPPAGPEFDFGALVMGAALVSALATGLAWLSGWIFIASAPGNAAVAGAQVSRQVVRGLGVLGRLAILALVGLIPLASLRPSLSVIASGCAYVAFAALGGTTFTGLWLLADLARRLGAQGIGERAKSARVGCCVVAIAVILFPIASTNRAFATSSLGVVPLALGAVAVLGSLWMVGTLTDFAGSLRSACATVYEAQSGQPHWSSRRRFQRMMFRVGGIVRRAKAR